MDEKICRDVTAQRIRKAIEGYGDVLALGGGFRYCKLGPGLFDESGNIGMEVRFGDLAAPRLLHRDRQSACPSEAMVRRRSLGVHQGRAIYLLFNGILGTVALPVAMF